MVTFPLLALLPPPPLLEDPEELQPAAAIASATAPTAASRQQRPVRATPLPPPSRSFPADRISSSCCPVFVFFSGRLTLHRANRQAGRDVALRHDQQHGGGQ